MKKSVSFLLALFVCVSASVLNGCNQQKTKKYAIILQADTDRHEGTARAFHALLYAKELKQTGYEVALIFDGAGTRWIEEFTRPEGKNPLIPAYLDLAKSGIVQVVCDFCSNSFQVKQSLQERDVPLSADFEGHPSIATLAEKGYELVVF